jgi:hypothetical protein
MSQRLQEEQEPAGKWVRTDEEGPLEQAAREFVEGDHLQAEANLLLSQSAIHHARSDAILNQYRILS